MRVYRRAGRPCPRCGTVIRSRATRHRRAADDVLVPTLPAREGDSDVSRIDVDCRPASDAWTCGVDIIDEASRSRHIVAVRTADLARLDPTAADPNDLVRRSFDFLLARESKESILSTFDLTVIARYFPEYESEILRRV